jgi:hypothetical protein
VGAKDKLKGTVKCPAFAKWVQKGASVYLETHEIKEKSTTVLTIPPLLTQTDKKNTPLRMNMKISFRASYGVCVDLYMHLMGPFLLE